MNRLKKKNKTAFDYLVRRIFFLALLFLAGTFILLKPYSSKIKNENLNYQQDIIELTRTNDTYNYLINNSVNKEKAKEYLLTITNLNPDDVDRLLEQYNLLP